VAVTVRLQFRPTCPRCDELIEKLMEVSARTGIEFIPEMVSTELETHLASDEVHRTYSEEWMKEHGTQKQRALYEKAKPLFKYLEGSSTVPVLIVEWDDGGKKRQIIIKGFSQEKFDIAVKNLIYTISRITLRSL
jgi:glutaredoxin